MKSLSAMTSLCGTLQVARYLSFGLLCSTVTAVAMAYRPPVVVVMPSPNIDVELMQRRQQTTSPPAIVGLETTESRRTLVDD